ncbi:MAG: ABC-F family ATP-binding cassette domain-containing protein [Firmicutes bacterium]|nr:ABC-F family ATP-binding cassette domain-containing protein [Bacillota bacterium]
MLQVQHLTIHHIRDLRTILDDFSCTLNAGDKAVIIGEEGNGKSTLLKWIFRPELIEDYAEAEGVCVKGSERLAYLPQQLPEEDAARTVYEFFAEEPLFSDAAPHRLAKLAASLGLPSDVFYSDHPMGTLSGGEKVKTQLARLLLAEPTALLLDEPSNDIDIRTLEFLERVIWDFSGIVLFISHDETLIERTATMVIHLEQVHRKQQCRHTVARMDYRDYAEKRLNAFEKQAQQAQSDLRKKRIRDEKYRRILQSVDRAQRTINHAGRDNPDPMQAARNLKDKMHTVKSLKKRFEREDAQMTEKPVQEAAIDFTLGENATPIPAGKTVLDFELPELLAADGSRLLAKNIRLLVRGPEKVCITGDNGCGKTTLLKAIWEQLKSRTDIRAAYMPQNYEDLLDPDQLPVDAICTRGDAEERTMVRTYLGALRFTTAEMEHPVRALSGGQQAKIFLLRLNLSGANVLLLDEPTRNFSPLSGPVIRRMLSAFPGAILSVSHDRKYIEEVCGTVLELTEGGLVQRFNPALPSGR